MKPLRTKKSLYGAPKRCQENSRACVVNQRSGLPQTRGLHRSGHPHDLSMLPQQEMISHAGDIIADDAVTRLPCRQLGIISRQRLGMRQIVAKELLERLHGTGLPL